MTWQQGEIWWIDEALFVRFEELSDHDGVIGMFHIFPNSAESWDGSL